MDSALPSEYIDRPDMGMGAYAEILMRALIQPEP